LLGNDLHTVSPVHAAASPCAVATAAPSDRYGAFITATIREDPAFLTFTR